MSPFTVKRDAPSFQLAWLSCFIVLTGLTACGGGGGGGGGDGDGDGGNSNSVATQTSAPPAPEAGAPAADSTPAPTAETPPTGTPSTDTPATETPESPAIQAEALSTFQTQVLQRVNAARASGTTCGGVAAPAVASVRWNAALEKAARGHSQDMATKNYFSHTSQDGRTFSQRIIAEGYSPGLAAENIAAGQQSVDDVMNSWLASAGHCRNIMRAGLKDIGVAVVRTTTAGYSTYWTMDLASPR